MIELRVTSLVMWTERDETERKFSRSSFSSDTMMRTWIFFSLFVLLLVTPAEFSDVVGHEPVQVTAGDDVILPCHLTPPFDVTDQTVEWTRNDLTVHGYTDRKDVYNKQDEQFRGRTSLFPDELVKGNISLKLTNVTEDDSGLYICSVPRLNSQVKRGNVLLRVNHLVQATAGDEVILSCHLDPPFDVTKLTVEWTRDGSYVHVYKERKHDHPQDEQFKNRTSLFPDELVKGNISLKLTNVTEDDSGLYICSVPKLNSAVKRGNVLLRVNPQKDPEGGDNETQDDKKLTRDQTGVVVSCVVGAVIIAVSAVMFFYIKYGRREKKEQDKNQQREQQNPEEKNPLGPVSE